jgi:hypothetical protein
VPADANVFLVTSSRCWLCLRDRLVVVVPFATGLVRKPSMPIVTKPFLLLLPPLLLLLPLHQVLTCQPLPDAEAEFFELLNLYFPNVFDMK